jgi:DNA-binding MarR family transcriptional regulator
MSSQPLAIEPIPAHSTVLVARIARVVRQRFEQTLTPFGLRQRLVVALSYLREHGPTAQQRLAEQLCMDASSTVCLLNELEESGFVVRRRDRRDRRRGIVELSPAGLRALGQVDRALQAVEDEILAPLADGERSVLHDLLARLALSGRDWGIATDAP